MKGYLNESITIDELDKTMAALEAATACACQTFCHRVLKSTILSIDFLVDVFENNNQEPDDS